MSMDIGQCDTRKNAVFFDFDDTLINTTAASIIAYESVRSLLEHGGAGIVSEGQFERVIEEYARFLSLVPNDSYKSQTPEKIRSELWEKALRECSPMVNTADAEANGSQFSDLAKSLYHAWYTTRLEKMEWLEFQTVPVLLALRQKYKLVLITNGSSVIQWEKIQRLGAEQYFDHVLVSGDEPHDKPHKSIFLKACKLSNTPPSKCIMIGDNVATDILGANQTGLLAAILFQQCDSDEKSYKESHTAAISHTRCNFAVSTIMEIPSLVEKIFERQ